MSDYEMSEIQSYLEGGDYAGLGTALPIFFSNLLGRPRQYPYVLSLRSDRDPYQSYYDMQIASQFSPVLEDVRERNIAASEQNLTVITSRLGKTLGLDLQKQQVEVIRNAANLVARYGPSVLSGIKKVLQADGVTDDDQVGKIIEGLTNQLDQVFDALYGPVGDRLPFYGALKDSLRDTVAIDEQAAIAQNVIQRLYPNEADLNQTHGMTAAMVGQLYSAMVERGLSPLNINSTEAQRLIRENISKDVSPAEKKAMVQNIAQNRRRQIYQASETGRALDTMTATANNRNKGTGKPAISAKIMSDYAKQLYRDQFISKEIYELGVKYDETHSKKGEYLLNEGETLASKATAIERPKDRSRYLQGIATQLTIAATSLQRDDNTAEEKKKIERLNKLSEQVVAYATADTNYTAAGGYIGTDENGYEKVLYGDDFLNKLNETQGINLANALIESGINNQEANIMADAMLLRERLESYDIIENANRLATDSEYSNELLNRPDLSDEIKKDIQEFTRQDENLGNKSLAEIAIEADNHIKQISEKKAEKDYNAVLQQYKEILKTGTAQDIVDFENDPTNRDVITQIKANEIGKQGTEDITNWTSAYRNMQKAIERTGGTINGQRIQFMPQTTNPAVVQVMELLTQKDLSNMTSKDIGDFFNAVSMGMQKSGLGADQALQYSGLAATEAAKSGGDRVVAGKVGTQLGLAAAAIARSRGYGNAERVGSMVAQATGRASKSLITQYTGAIAYRATDDVIDKMTNQRAKDIVTKIKNMANLSQDELSYLQEHGQEIMADMGMTSEQQRSAMLSTWAGKRGEYALEQGTTFLLGNQNSDMLIATRDAIGTNLASSGLDKSISRNRTITQAIVDTMTDNLSYIRDNNVEGFKEALLANLQKKLENKEITQEQYDTIANTSAGDIFQAVNRGKDIVGKFTGSWSEGLKTIAISNGILDEKTKEIVSGKAQELFPTIGSPNWYSNLIGAMAQENSNLGDIFKAIVTNGGTLSESDVQNIGYGVAIMSLLRPEDHIDDFNYSSDQAKSATFMLQKLAESDPDNADKTFGLIRQTKDIIEKRGFGNLENLLNGLNDEEKTKQLIEEGRITEEEIETVRNTNKLITSNGFTADEFTKMTSEIAARSAKTEEALSKTPNISVSRLSTKPNEQSRTTTPADSSSVSSQSTSSSNTTENVNAAVIREGSKTESVATTSSANNQTTNSKAGTSTIVADSTAGGSSNNDTKGISDLLNQVVDGGNLKVVVTNVVTTVEGEVGANPTAAPPTPA